MKQNVGTQIFQYQYMRTGTCRDPGCDSYQKDRDGVSHCDCCSDWHFFLFTDCSTDKDCKDWSLFVLKIARSLMCVSGPKVRSLR